MTKNGMIVNQRDIILITLPFSNLTKKKKRPAIIISNNDYNSNNSDIICCAITSNLRDYANSIIINLCDLDSGVLFYKSRIKPSKIFTLDQDLIIKKIAKLKIDKTRQVVDNLNNLVRIVN